MKYTPYKKKDGKTYYMFKVSLPTDPATGKRKHTVRRGFRTKKEAEIAYLRLIAEEDEVGGQVKTTFGEVYAAWFDVYKHSVRESTYNKTESLFKCHILPRFKDTKIQHLQLQHIQKEVNEWAGYFKNFKTLKNYTSLVFDHAIRMKIISENPCRLVIMPKPKKSEPKENYYSLEELTEFLNKAKESMESKWYLFFRILAYTGMRKGEALALTWEDIDLARKQITINKTLTLGINNRRIIQPPKTGSGNRIVDIDVETVACLKNWRFQQIQLLRKLGFQPIRKDQLLFSTEKNTFHVLQAPTNELERFYKKNPMNKITPHGFRHTHCSLLFEAGASIPEVQVRLGHSDIHTTMNIYNHVTAKKKLETVDKFTAYMVAGQNAGQEK